MQFENCLMKLILKHCEGKVKDMTAEEAWQLAKKISLIAKPKSRKEIQNSLTQGRI